MRREVSVSNGHHHRKCEFHEDMLDRSNSRLSSYDMCSKYNALKPCERYDVLIRNTMG